MSDAANNFTEASNNKFADAENVTFLVRWRGRQEGPYSASAIEAKLRANEIGLLHEILHNGRWITLRDYMAEKQAALRAEQQAQEERGRYEREAAERKAREREEQLSAAMLVEERRKNDLLAAEIERQNKASPAFGMPQMGLKPHRGGAILALALIGLFVCGPLCLVAWLAGSSDLREIDSGIMGPKRTIKHEFRPHYRRAWNNTLGYWLRGFFR